MTRFLEGFMSVFRPFSARNAQNQQVVDDRVSRLGTAIRKETAVIPEIRLAATDLEAAINKAKQEALLNQADLAAKMQIDFANKSRALESERERDKANHESVLKTKDGRIALLESELEETRSKLESTTVRFNEKSSALLVAEQEVVKKTNEYREMQNEIYSHKEEIKRMRTQIAESHMVAESYKMTAKRDIERLNLKLETLMHTLAAQGSIAKNVLAANPQEVGTAVSLALCDEDFSAPEKKALYEGSKIFSDLSNGSLDDFTQCMPSGSISESAKKKVVLVSKSVQPKNLESRLAALKPASSKTVLSVKKQKEPE